MTTTSAESPGIARPRVSVVCPFYNEAAIIESAVRAMLAQLRRQFGDQFELILVNDGSVDASVELLLEALRGCDERVRLLSLRRNRGRGRALKTGIDAAAGAIVVTTEVDLSWGESVAADLVGQLDERAELDFVVASPHLPGGGLVNVPAHRRLLTRLGNRLIRLFFASGITMNTGMTRAYRRHVIQPLITYEDGKEFHLEVLLKLLTMGFRAGEIPAAITWPQHKVRRRLARKSSTKIVRTIGTHLKFVAVAQPVRQFGVLSILALFVGSTFLTAAFVQLVRGGPAVFFALIGLIMLLFCLLFAGFAILFFQFRNFMREQLLQSYPADARPGVAADLIPVTPGSQRPVN